MRADTYDEYGAVESLAVFNEVEDAEVKSYVNPGWLADAAETLADHNVTDAELVVGHFEDSDEDAPNVPLIGLKDREGSLGVIVAPRAPTEGPNVFRASEDATECEHCGYEWNSSSEMVRVTCPSCQRKTAREEADA